MPPLLDLYKRYVDEEYTLADVSRILSYIAVPHLSEDYIRQVENQIEWIRFMCERDEQKEKVISLLDEMIDRIKTEE